MKEDFKKIGYTLREISDYFCKKTPREVTFADADNFDYEISEILQKWQKAFPEEPFEKEFPCFDALWEELASWNAQECWTHERAERIIRLAEKALKETDDYLKKRIIEGIVKELEILSSENSRDFFYSVESYVDTYYEDSICALILKWEQLGYGDFDSLFPVTAKLVAKLKSVNDGIERSREVYADIIALAKDALKEVREYKISMIGEEYNEKAQMIKARMQEMIAAEYKYVDSRSEYIDSLIERFGDLSDYMVELLNLKKDNEDARAFLASLENMLKNRLTADGISRFNELLQGYLNYSDAIGEDLEKFEGFRK